MYIKSIHYLYKLCLVSIIKPNLIRARCVVYIYLVVVFWVNVIYIQLRSKQKNKQIGYDHFKPRESFKVYLTINKNKY